MLGGTGAGFLNNTMFLAGNMEYLTAVNSVGLGGGSLTVTTPLTYSYRTQNASKTRGQYRYQVIRVPRYNDVVLRATISPPGWNGNVGGVLAFLSTGTFHFNGFSMNSNGCGFRGGASRQLFGTGFNSIDYLTYSTLEGNGSKGEGISGLPRYIFDGAVIDNGVEGIPGGSCGMGAPGNASGGGTDANLSNNNENTGGVGGSNGGSGGKGGNSWRSNQPYGGEGGGSLMAYVGANRIFMGGGGGAGSNNNFNSSHGGKGGGIIILDLNQIISAGTIMANGTDGGSVANDGGGGGTVMLRVNSGMAGVTIFANGGDGGYAWGTQAPRRPISGHLAWTGRWWRRGRNPGQCSGESCQPCSSGGSGRTTTLLDPYGSSGGAGGMVNSSLLYTPTPCVLADVRISLVADRLDGQSVSLNWNLEGEATGGYTIQRAGADWMIREMDSRIYSGPSDSWTDLDATLPLLYYLIKLQDPVGASYYSPWIEVRSASSDQLLVYPNTGSRDFTIASVGPDGQIQMYDATWKEVFTTRNGTYQFACPEAPQVRIASGLSPIPGSFQYCIQYSR